MSTSTALGGTTGAASSDDAAPVGPRPVPVHVLALATTHLRTPSDVDAAAAAVAAVADLPPGVLVGSSLAQRPEPHLALVVLSPSVLPGGVVDAVAAAAGATDVAEDVGRRAMAGDVDRVAVFPGRERVTGVLVVADALSCSALDAVAGLGGLVVPDDALLDTRDHVRPRLAAGRLVLDVQPARGGRWVPFEPPVQHACCSAH